MEKLEEFVNITILSEGGEIRVLKGTLLSDAIRNAGINLVSNCNNHGICGKCIVDVKKQPVSDGLSSGQSIPCMNLREEELLKHGLIAKNQRLACQLRVFNDLIISIPESSKNQNIQIIEHGIHTDIALEPCIKKYFIRDKISGIKHIKEAVIKKTGINNIIFPEKIIEEIKGFKDEISELTITINDNNEILHIEKGLTIDKNFGIAIDIGTTTIAVELISLYNGEIIAVETAINEQNEFGADVVSRLSFAYEKSDNAKLLQGRILNLLNKLIIGIAAKNNINSNNIYMLAVSGNTVMNHLLLNKPINTLAVSPFIPSFKYLEKLNACEEGININEYAELCIMPNIEGFVGGDISAGIVASDLFNKNGNYLFVDLGTNGEIVLKKGNKLIATSTAAGPAFEGMNISCGMIAQPGAIFKAEIENNKLAPYTIQNIEAKGICGTGLIDILSILLEFSEIDVNGKIINEEKRINITGDIFIIQKDVRELQMAVSAVKAGIKMILDEYSVDINELKGLIIAGAFGNFLNIKNCIKIGLFPSINEGKVVFIGNSSLAGARMALLNKNVCKELKNLVRQIEYCNLAGRPEFQEIFIDALQFCNDDFYKKI